MNLPQQALRIISLTNRDYTPIVTLFMIGTNIFSSRARVFVHKFQATISNELFIILKCLIKLIFSQLSNAKKPFVFNDKLLI